MFLHVLGVYVECAFKMGACLPVYPRWVLGVFACVGCVYVECAFWMGTCVPVLGVGCVCLC